MKHSINPEMERFRASRSVSTAPLDMRGMKRRRTPAWHLAVCLLAAVGCSDQGDERWSEQDRGNDEAAGSSDELVRRVAELSDDTVVIFDFDETLFLDRGTQEAAFAREAIEQLDEHDVNVAICSMNDNRSGLAGTLGDLNPSVFNAGFLADDSVVFQTDSGVEKRQEIRAILSHLGVEEHRAVFFDDKTMHIDEIRSETNVHAIHVDIDGLDQPEFDEGMRALLGDGAPDDDGDCDLAVHDSEYCSKCGPCGVGEGDCDSHDECLDGLMCMGEDGSPHQNAGHDICVSGDDDDGGGDDGGGGGGGGDGNLRIQLDGGSWRSVGCYAAGPLASGSSQRWTVSSRTLRSDNGLYLHCPESFGPGDECVCKEGSGEAYHAIAEQDGDFKKNHPSISGNELDSGLKNKVIWIFPNSGHEICLSAWREGDEIKIKATDANINLQPGGNHAESKHDDVCSRWCFGDGCP